MKLLYNLGVHLIVFCAFFRKRSRKQFRARLGKDFPEIKKGERPLIWVHAVSVGETKAIAPLVKKLKHSPASPLILFTSITATGHEEALRSIPEADWHAFLPFDLSYKIRPLVKKISPDLVLISETDFWHHFESGAKESGAKIVLINGKISERSYHRYLNVKKLAQFLLSPIDFFCVQGKVYAERFNKIGISENKILITGNTKLDGLGHKSANALSRAHLGVKGEDLLLTCGSTHNPEEKILLRSLEKLWQHYPHLKVLLVPRHPERFEAVAQILKQHNISFSRISHGEVFGDSQVMLVDKMGLLNDCYRISDVAFVGGSLTPKVGGHNILEPAFYGVPVLYGPHMHAQPDLLDLMQIYHAGIQVNMETITPTLDRLLKHPHKRKELGKNGLKLVQEAQGAIDVTYQALSQFLPLAGNSSMK